LSDFNEVRGWPGQFDLVVSFETFEHVPKSHGRQFMEKLFEWTRPGGTCLFSTPNAGVSDSTAENHIDPVTGESREWSYDDKIELVRDVGFDIEDTFGTFCGIRRLPPEVQNKLKHDPEWKKIKKFLTHSLLTCILSVPYPHLSNNSLFHMTRRSD
jgi:SAM-dependent methyltransferase